MRLSTRFVASVTAAPLAAVLVLAGCGSNPGEGAGNGAGGPTRTGPQSSAATPVPTATDQLPSPDAAQETTLLAALTAVDPALALDDASAVQNAVALCGALREGDDPATAVPATFPDADLDAGQQAAVAAAVTSGFCPLTGASGSSSGSSGSSDTSISPDASGTAVAT